MITLKLRSSTGSPISFNTEVPPELFRLLLPEAEVAYASGEFGSVLLQQLHINGMTILYCHSKILRDVAIHFDWQPGAIQVHACLKTGYQLAMEGWRKMLLEEGRFNILRVSALKGTCWLPGGRCYESLHVTYSPPYLGTLRNLFAPLDTWMAGKNDQPKLLFKRNPFLTPELKEVIKSLLTCNNYEDRHSYYMEVLTRQFLFFALVPSVAGTHPEYALRRQDVETIREAKRWIDTHYDSSFRIATITENFGIRELRLRTCFKKMYSVSITDYLLRVRMSAAKKLLSETDMPLKQIADKCSYSTARSFLKAFKRFFRHTPGAYRKAQQD